MRAIILFALMAISLRGSLAADLNWCGLASCNLRRHITCDLPGDEYSDNCPSSAIILDLRTAQDSILAEHNKLRNKIAGGQIQGFDKASHMGTVRWNVTFANLARRNVKMCVMERDGCRNTPDFIYVGQNIGSITYPTVEDPQRNNLQMILNIINLWFDQYQDSSMVYINSYKPKTLTGANIALFSQMVRDYVTRVGCAALKLNNIADATTTLLLTCNYDLALFGGWPVYDVDSTATAAGSKCETGMNPAYPNLCSSAEDMDPNHFMDNYQ